MTNGGPAFPRMSVRLSEISAKLESTHYEGMTLRDYFAALAMQSSLNSAVPEVVYREALEAGSSMSAVHAKRAYEMADAMLRARQDGEL